MKIIIVIIALILTNQAFSESIVHMKKNVQINTNTVQVAAKKTIKSAEINDTKVEFLKERKETKIVDKSRVYYQHSNNAIIFENISSFQKIIISDLSGNILYNYSVQSIQNNQIQVDFSKGVYLIGLIDKNRIVSHKISF